MTMFRVANDRKHKRQRNKFGETLSGARRIFHICIRILETISSRARAAAFKLESIPLETPETSFMLTLTRGTFYDVLFYGCITNVF